MPLNINMAIEKYISSPVTSQSVAMNGADDVAGSNLSFFKSIGIIDPIVVPHITTPINEKLTVKAISNQCWP